MWQKLLLHPNWKPAAGFTGITTKTILIYSSRGAGLLLSQKSSGRKSLSCCLRQVGEPDERFKSDSLLFGCVIRAESGKCLAGRQEAVPIAQTANTAPSPSLGFSQPQAEPSRLQFQVAFPPFCLLALALQRLLAVSCMTSGMDGDCCGCCCHELAISWLKEAKFRPNPLKSPKENHPLEGESNSFSGVHNDRRKGTQEAISQIFAFSPVFNSAQSLVSPVFLELC